MRLDVYKRQELMLVIRSKDINKQLEEGMMEYERVSRQVLELSLIHIYNTYYVVVLLIIIVYLT